ncbi:MAG: ATP-grasp domain-containing protein [Nesterenkonia sp.]|nr:ATP-grasp domain-containing protein [Nesterenkonia sp.]
MVGESERYRVLLVGGSIQSLDQPVGQERLKRFAEAADYSILNLSEPEGSVAAQDESAEPDVLSGFEWGAVTALGLDAVNLTGVVASDRSVSDVGALMDVVDETRLDHFGVGRTLSEALAPLSIDLPTAVGGGTIEFHGSAERGRRTDEGSGRFADDESPGCVPLTVPDVPERHSPSSPTDSLHVAVPLWGRGAGWRTDRQFKLAHRFFNKDYDLVVGYGSERAQEVHRKRRRWVVYNIGDGAQLVQAQDRTSEPEEGLPCSFWAMLEVAFAGEGRRLTLKLYPTPAPSRRTDPADAGEAELDDVSRTLAARPIRPWRFDNPARSTGTDDLGPHIALDLGAWPIGQPPARLESPTDDGDPSEWPLRSPETALEDDMLRLNRDHNASMLGLGAQAAGATTHWLSNYYALVEAEDTRFLIAGALAHESALGSRIVGDKVLTSKLLESAGVATPRTRLAQSAAEAVDAAREFPGPVVVKPRNGHKSQGVSTDLRTDDEVREAFDYARRYRRDVIVQEYIEATEELRVMASPDEVVAVNIRIFPHVIGDGVSTVEQLILDKNLQRTLNPTLGPSPIPVDSLTRRHLERQGLSLSHVVEMGQRIQVRNVGGVSVGADIHQALEETSENIREAAKKTIAAVPGLGWGGVDLIIEKETGKAYVIEVNTTAAFSSAAFPTYGRPRDVTKQIWKIRRAATVPSTAPDAPIEVAGRRDEASPLVDGPQEEPDSVPMSRILDSSLKAQGFTVTRRNNLIRVVTSPEGHSTWMTSTGLTAPDRGVVRRFIRHHQRVIDLLDLAGVPRVRGRSVTTGRGISTFLNRPVGSVVLVPRETAWGSQEAEALTRDEALAVESLDERTWIQAVPSGRHLRVLATPHQAWVIVESGSVDQRSSTSAVETAGRAAVQAVRAVPELRWAAVDVVVRPAQQDQALPQRALVEGLSQGPVFSADDLVLAGDIDAFCRMIVTGEGLQ